jgi:hypothetical protein
MDAPIEPVVQEKRLPAGPQIDNLEPRLGAESAGPTRTQPTNLNSRAGDAMGDNSRGYTPRDTQPGPGRPVNWSRFAAGSVTARRTADAAPPRPSPAALLPSPANLTLARRPPPPRRPPAAGRVPRC